MATHTTVKRQVYHIAKWTPGLNTRTPASDLTPGEAAVALNVDLSGGTLKPRVGFSKPAGSPDVNKDTVGLGLFSTRAAGVETRYMLAVGGLTLTQQTDITPTNITTTVIPSGQVQSAIFTTIADAVYIALKDIVGGVYALRKWSPGGGFSITTSPAGDIVATYGNALWVASSNGSRVFWSGTFGNSGVDVWPANNFIDVGPGDGDIITGLVAHGTSLLVLKRNSIYRITGVQPNDAALATGTIVVTPLASQDGCIAPQTVASRNGQTIWLGQRGVFMYDGVHIKEISINIRATIVSASNAVVTARGSWLSNYQYLLFYQLTAYIFTFSPDFSIAQWTFGTSNPPICAIKFAPSLTTADYVWYGLKGGGGAGGTGINDSVRDAGADVNWMYRTGALPLGPVTTLKLTRFAYLRQSVPGGFNTFPVTVALRPDFSDNTGVTATAISPVNLHAYEFTQRLVLPLVARTVSLEISGTQAAGSLWTPEIEEFNVDYIQRLVP